MMYDKETLKNRQTKGQVNYKKELVLSVINLAVKEIAGVSSLVIKFENILKRWFSKNYCEGVKISYNNDIINVDVYINVYYGYNVSDIAYRVQENVKNSLTSMIEAKVGEINVHVIGVDFPTDEAV